MFREWLRSMLREHGGPFFDAFRSKHPERTGAYTCFNQKVGAEEYNYGSRIDHILISGACLHHCDSVEDHSIFYCHVEECEIMNNFKRGNSETLSKWKGGRSSKLEGSDHIPVYILLKEIPELPVHNIPPSAARYLPELRGRQQSIVSFLKKGKSYELQDATNLNLSEDRVDDSPCSDGLENKIMVKEELVAGITEFSKGGILPSLMCKGRNLDQWINEGSSGVSHNSKKASFSCAKSAPNKKIKRNISSQPTIKSFFQQPGSKTGNASTTILVTPMETVNYTNETFVPNDDSLPENMQCTTSAPEDQDNTNTSCSLSTDKCNSATVEWQRIQQKMKMTLPHCKGHREPCIPRSVKKGSNIGRLFYVCARAQGPSSNPEANCGHFQWAPVKFKEKRL
uniref:GRF-type domain-containing protein n=2 Tax=Arundo donax TaxID=35708 RepID=A0A0A9FP33_ARUDO